LLVREGSLTGERWIIKFESTLDLNAARMFVTAVQAGSLSAAAERLALPLATLSRRIRKLEDELKVQLFERSTRGVRLTDSGSRLYEYAVRGIEALVDGERAVQNEQALLKGRLRLSIPPSFEPWWALLRCFQERYPNVQLNVFATERRVDLISDGIDVVLRVGNAVDESLVARQIVKYRHILVAAPSLIAELGEPKSLDDLHAFPCAAWSANVGSCPPWQLGDVAHEPRTVLTSNDYFQLRHGALRGDFITELPPFLAADQIKQGVLLPILSSKQFPVLNINLLYHSHRYLSAVVRAYLDFCAKAAPRHLSF